MELDFYPNTASHLHGKNDDLLELPTIANDFASLSKDLQSLDLKSLVTNIDNLAKELSVIASSGKIDQTLDNFNNAAIAVRNTALHIDTTQATFSESGMILLAQLDSLLAQLNKDEPQLAQSLNDSLATLRNTLTNIDELTTQVGYSLDQNSPLLIELTKTLAEIHRAARSLRSLSETLDEQPEAIIQGKKGE